MYDRHLFLSLYLSDSKPVGCTAYGTPLFLSAKPLARMASAVPIAIGRLYKHQAWCFEPIDFEQDLFHCLFGYVLNIEIHVFFKAFAERHYPVE